MIFFLHRNREYEVYSQFLAFLNDNFDLRSDENAPIICDRELGLKRALIYYGINLVLCFNHVIRNTKYWYVNNVKKQFLSQKEVKIFFWNL